MAADERNPKNAPGPFYVLKGCIACCTPEAVAPELVTGGESDVGCYFMRQPESPQEIDAAISAMLSSCVGIFRYGGHDLEIRRRLAELGESRVCDHPLVGHPEVIRNLVRFRFGNPWGALSLAELLVRRFLTSWGEDCACTMMPNGDPDVACFQVNRSVKYLRPQYYRLIRLLDGWLLAGEKSDGRPWWLEELLREVEATDLRWFSEEEWRAGASGKPRPF
jgi:hypothetical protein